ncbi:MAG: HNH endonuclease [Lachnospiraceae bacterium]|nr:HNH endonuclease [Lachnospiraceae bacterium]
MKRMILERDEYTCQICGISRDFVDELCPGLGDYLLLEIDHIESVAQGGSGRDGDNLQVLCWRCNRKKGGRRTNEQVRETIDYGIDFLEE